MSDEQNNSEWPQHFPADCPPTDAELTNGRIYYLVKTNPPTSADLMSALERGVFERADRCMRAALSCYRDASYLDELRDIVPRLADTQIAEADLEPKHGCIKKTCGPGHYSLWLRRVVLAQFHVILQVEAA